MNAINQLDLAFVVDTTGSMGHLLDAAQRQMIEMIDALRRAASVDMQLGVVQYRDHPPQDRMVYEAFDLTGDLAAAKKYIGRLRANGGGDECEAVFAGLVAAGNKLSWRVHARRIAVLVGDAPPHGVGARGDTFHSGCPSGETIHSASAQLEAKSIRLYAIGLTAVVADSFGKLSTLTGGQYFSAGQGPEAIRRLEQLLANEFGQLEFDQSVYSAWGKSDAPSVETIAELLAETPARVAGAVSRLSQRDLIAL
jgi:hypothetical protein